MVWSGSIGFWWVLLGFYRALPGFWTLNPVPIGFLPSFLGFDRVWSGLIGLGRVVTWFAIEFFQEFTGFDRVLADVTGFYWVGSGSIGLAPGWPSSWTGFHWGLAGFSGFFKGFTRVSTGFHFLFGNSFGELMWFYRVLPNFLDFYRVLLRFFLLIRFYCVILWMGLGFYWSFFCRVFKSGSLSATVVELQTGFYWVFTGFYRALLGFTGFFLGLTGFDLVWLGLTGFDWVFRGSTGF